MKLYYENHLGERIYFYRSPYVIISHSFFDWLLSYTKVNNRTSGYHFNAKEADFTVRLLPLARSAELRESMFAELYDEFVEVVSADTDVPGRLLTDTGEYISCRFVSSAKSNWNIPRNVNIACKISIDDPTWKRSEVYEISYSPETEYEYLDYPYDFSHDYKGDLPGYVQIWNDSTEDSDYIMTIYGAASRPKVVLNGIDVGADVVIGESEKLVINSAEQTAVVLADGVRKNVFNQRYKGARSMFSKLPPGTATIFWSGNFHFDLEVIRKRREPSWA